MGEVIPYPGIKEEWNDRGNAKVMYVADEQYNSSTFEYVIKDIHPDYIYLQGLFQGCVMPCLRLAKKYGIKVILAPRGELCAGAFRKKYKKIPYILCLRMMGFLKNVEFQSTSDEETEAIKHYLKVGLGRIHYLTNIPSIPHGLAERGSKNSGECRFVFISRILWKKNLLSAIKYLDGIKGKVTFDIYGPIEEDAYWTECETAIKALPSNIKVNYCGVLSHDDILNTFNQYDAFLFPTLSENFGHVIAEALVTGCIPIISDQTPWTDMNEAGAGWALPLTAESQFKNAIQEVVNMDYEALFHKRKTITKYLKDKLQLDKLKGDYVALFK